VISEAAKGHRVTGIRLITGNCLSSGMYFVRTFFAPVTLDHSFMAGVGSLEQLSSNSQSISV
jgi:hypothetical protein